MLYHLPVTSRFCKSCHHFSIATSLVVSHIFWQLNHWSFRPGAKEQQSPPFTPWQVPRSNIFKKYPKSDPKIGRLYWSIQFGESTILQDFACQGHTQSHPTPTFVIDFFIVNTGFHNQSHTIPTFSYEHPHVYFSYIYCICICITIYIYIHYNVKHGIPWFSCRESPTNFGPAGPCLQWRRQAFTCDLAKAPEESCA